MLRKPKTVQAVILAAGMGTRLRPLTDDRPKGMVEIGGKPMLWRQLDALARAGVEDVVITTGYRSAMLRAFVRKNFPSLNIRFVHNRRYAQTNTAYSLLKTRRHVTASRVLFLHADLVFDPHLLTGLLTLDTSAVTVQKQTVKDWGVRVQADRVQYIGPDIAEQTGLRVFFAYVFSRKDWTEFMDSLALLIQDKKWQAYAEFGLASILDRIYLGAFISELAGVEVDTSEDAKQAELWFQKNTYENT